MTVTPYRTIIGLEVHVELGTATKMFCRCKNEPFGARPNEHTCPVCMGLPGTLPVPNLEAVRKTITVGLALGSEIPQLAKWDRKHYFYPDLPKGYQISQYDLPFCVGGKLELLGTNGEVESVVRFERVHLEEDAGKLMHGGKQGYSQVDLNRAGVPLIEMVSKADLTSAAQARRFLQELQLLMRTLGVSDADMEKGQMRCDVNVNIAFTEEGKEVRTPITEVKNVNSTRAVERSILTEAQRQYEEWMANGPIRTRINKLTAGWDEDHETVNVQRAKEAANDYRYMPEPDLPPVLPYEHPELNPDKLRELVPELPNVRRQRYLKLGIPIADIEVLVQDPLRLATLERTLSLPEAPAAKTVATWLLNAPEVAVLEPLLIQQLIRATTRGEASFSELKSRLTEVAEYRRKNPSQTAEQLLSALGLLHQHDSAVVESAIAAVLAEHVQVVAEYRSGNERLFGFLVGQVMRRVAGQAQPAKVSEALKEAIAADKKAVK